MHLFNNLDKAQSPPPPRARINGETRQSLHPEELDANTPRTGDACAREKSSREPLETSFHKPLPFQAYFIDMHHLRSIRAPSSLEGEGVSSAVAKASEKKSNLSFGGIDFKVFSTGHSSREKPGENVLLAHPFLLGDASDLLISPGRNIEHGRWPSTLAVFPATKGCLGNSKTDGGGGAATTGVRKV